MKSILSICAFTIIFISCNNTGKAKSDEIDDETKQLHRSVVQTYINLHNIKASTDLGMAWIEERKKIRNQFRDMQGTKEYKDYLESSHIVFRNNWNQPYDINKDTALTYERYIEYCKANGKDTALYYKFLRK